MQDARSSAQYVSQSFVFFACVFELRTWPRPKDPFSACSRFGPWVCRSTVRAIACVRWTSRSRSFKNDIGLLKERPYWRRDCVVVSFLFLMTIQFNPARLFITIFSDVIIMPCAFVVWSWGQLLVLFWMSQFQTLSELKNQDRYRFRYYSWLSWLRPGTV